MNKKPTTKTTTFRQRAEEQMNKKSSKTSSQLSDGEILKLNLELQAHQIELEMQNIELKLAKEEAETATQKYTELLAPVVENFLDFLRRDPIYRSAKIAGDLQVFVSGD